MHYLRNLGLGGTEKTCQLFMQFSNKEKFETCLVHEQNGELTRLEQFRHSANIAHATIYEVNSYSNKSPNPSELRSAIKDFRPDIIHVYRSGFSEFPDNGIDIDVPNFIETNVFGSIDGNPRIDKTLFMSKWLMDNTLKGLIHPRFDFVNNPVEIPCTSDGMRFEAEGIENAIIVGRVGRPDNGIYNAVHVEAVRLLRLQGYDVRFLVVAPPENMLKDLIQAEIPHYIVPPTCSQLILSQAYNTMDIYAHARADGETFGVNIAEAMMHGLPVVTHIATPSFPGMGVFQSQKDLVSDGITGFVVTNDPVFYSEALKILIDNKDLRSRFGQAGAKKAFDNYEASVCVKKLEKIYEEVVREKAY